MTIQSIPRLPLSNPTGSFWILVLFFSACSGQAPMTVPAPQQEAPVEIDQVEANLPAVSSTSASSVPLQSTGEPTATAALSWAESTLSGMTLREKVGQLMMPFVLGNFAPEGSETHDRIVSVIEEEHVGGVIMLSLIHI